MVCVLFGALPCLNGMSFVLFDAMSQWYVFCTFCASLMACTHEQAEMIVPEPGIRIFNTRQMICIGDFIVYIVEPSQHTMSSWRSASG